MRSTNRNIVIVSLLLLAAIIALSTAPDALVHRLAAATTALAPLGTFAAIAIAVVGWRAAAQAAGEEARRTEREKRETADAAHRGLVRARIWRLWSAIDGFVGVRPYEPALLEHFVGDLETAYWQVDTFRAFSESEHELIRMAFDTIRLDNSVAFGMAQEAAREKVPGERPRDIIREAFITSLEAIATVFGEVYMERKLADVVTARHDHVRGLVDHARALQRQAATRDG